VTRLRNPSFRYWSAARTRRRFRSRAICAKMWPCTMESTWWPSSRGACRVRGRAPSSFGKKEF